MYMSDFWARSPHIIGDGLPYEELAANILIMALKDFYEQRECPICKDPECCHDFFESELFVTLTQGMGLDPDEIRKLI